MKVLKKTRWGAIALVIVLVLASSLALAGCDNGVGSGSGFDPVGTWRGTYASTQHTSEGTRHIRQDITLTFFANGTGTVRFDTFENHQFLDTEIGNFHFHVSDDIVQIFAPHGLSGVAIIIDRNTIVWHGVTFIRS